MTIVAILEQYLPLSKTAQGYDQFFTSSIPNMYKQYSANAWANLLPYSRIPVDCMKKGITKVAANFHSTTFERMPIKPVSTLDVEVVGNERIT